MYFLNSKYRFYLYLVLQNRFVQKLICKEEKQIIQKKNNEHNNFRPDYNYKDYQSGKNWSTFKVEDDYRGWLKFIPLFENKSRVLEIGPGSGYYSRFICENDNVEHYSFCELNIDLKNSLIDNLKKLQTAKKNFTFNSIDIDFLENKNDEKYDCIFFFSSFHHIPNRKEYFDKCFESLNPKGKIVFFEPTHLILRIIFLTIKFFKIYRHFNKNEILKNCSTHAFCTLGEFKSISKEFKGMYELKNTWIVKSRKIKKFLNYTKPKFLNDIIAKYFSAEMITIFEKK